VSGIGDADNRACDPVAEYGCCELVDLCGPVERRSRYRDGAGCGCRTGRGRSAGRDDRDDAQDGHPGDEEAHHLSSQLI
jgi:hypothetical protein